MTKKEMIDYVRDEADNYGVPFSHAMVLFDLLGESEMYDGFITMLQDYSETLSDE
jgi:hypothetical protein